MTRRLRLALLAGAGIAFGLGWLALRRLDLGEVAAHIRGVDPWVLALAPLAKLANLWLWGLRSRLMLRPAREFTLAQAVKSILVAVVVNAAVPLRAGEVARVAYLSRTGSLPPGTCVAMVGLERLLDSLCVLALVGLAVATVTFDLPLGAGVAWLGAASVAVVAALVWAGRHPASFVASCTGLTRIAGARCHDFVARQAEAFTRGLASLRDLRVLAVLGLLSIGVWASAVMAMQIWLWAFGLALPWHAPVLMLAAVSLGLALPATPGHVGTYHLMVIGALLAVGVPRAEATSVAIVGHAMAVGFPLVLAALLALHESARAVRTAGEESELAVVVPARAPAPGPTE